MTGINDLQTMFGAIDRSQGGKGTSGAENQPSAHAAAARGFNSSPVQDDQTVSLSSAAGSLAQVSGSDDVRHDKVAELQAAIQSGTYKVSAADVADKLMQSMLNGGR